MLRLMTHSASLLFVITCLALPAQASDTCARATGGKCKTGQTALSKPKANAAPRKPAKPQGNKLKSREQYTAAEREKIMERAREICRKFQGAPSQVYKIDYATSKVWCTPPSY